MSPACVGWWMQGEWGFAQLHTCPDKQNSWWTEMEGVICLAMQWLFHLTRQGRTLLQNIPKPRPLLFIPGFILARRNWKWIEELEREEKS